MKTSNHPNAKIPHISTVLGPSPLGHEFSEAPLPEKANCIPIKEYQSDVFLASSRAACPTVFSGKEEKYRKVVANIRASIEADNKNPLQEMSRSILLAHEHLPPRGLVVLFHGWSAGTWQYEHIAKKLYHSGFTVYAPRLPGHGFSKPDGLQDNRFLPKYSETRAYENYVTKIYRQIEEMPSEKSLIGFSGGGAIAMRTMQQYSGFKKGVLIAPFLRPQADYAKKLTRVLSAIEPYTFGGLGAVMNRIPYDMGQPGTKEGLAKGLSGHGDVSLGNVGALIKFGERVLDDAKPISTPVSIIMSAADSQSDSDAIRSLNAKLMGNPKNSYFEYPASMQVPHTMLHPKEAGCPKKFTDEVYTQASQFLLKD